ncbi:hypothetical protein F66182_5725 [Fusarium sp. NRRL 66182]|nr:hypothetical protein F66182_5725 [Fusarium sp. NRRL 66182]
MFPFDQASLPQITTRKALIGVDFQHDFIAKDGALPVPEPEGLVDRTIQLAQAFRDVGDVVWVQSQFNETRLAPEECIVLGENASLSRPPSRSSRQGPQSLPADTVEAGGPPDDEAFLSHEGAVCVEADTPGCRIASAIEDSSQTTDVKLTKSHYSAFQSTHLLRILRAKMVMELFICGSLANVGVYATALDAAGHGMAITIVDDCCGYRSESRKMAAIASLQELTGCEVASYEEVIEVIQPKSKPKPKPKTKTKSSKSRRAKAPSPPSKQLEQSRSNKSNPTEEEGREKSITPDYVKDMTSLRLASDTPSPTPPAAQPQPKASLTSAAEDYDSNVKAPSNAAESNGLLQATATETTNTPQKLDVPKDSPIKDAVADAADAEKESTKSEEQIIEPSLPQDTTKNSEQLIEPSHSTDATKEQEQKLKQTLDTRPDMPNTKNLTQPAEGHLQQKGLCEGDTDIIENVLPDPLVDAIFEKLRQEIQWQRMSHQGGQVPRLVAVQGEVASDGSIPVYRHPSDESPPLLPFSPTVLAIKAETEKQLGHSLNHVLIQFYRDGTDYISEHSDKTLDIVKGSYIANVSLGAERTMTFRTKKKDKDPSQGDASTPVDLKRTIQRARLPHNSLCRFGLKSNMKWLHAVRQDKRPKNQKSVTELAYEGGRISLTFRQIGTFLNREETLIWGQGARAKTRKDAHPVINGQSLEAIEMLKAFGTENHSSEFDWDAHYGQGFDVLHMSNAPRFFACGDSIVNMRIAIMLAEYGVNYARGSVTAGSESPSAESMVVKFTDKDKSTVQGDLAVMLYLDARYGLNKPGSASQTPEDLAARLTRFQRAMTLLNTWQSLPKDGSNGKRSLNPLKQELEAWDGFAAETDGSFIAGAELSLPDLALWPVLHSVVEELGMESLDGLKHLQEYYNMIGMRPGVKKVLSKESTPAPATTPDAS